MQNGYDLFQSETTTAQTLQAEYEGLGSQTAPQCICVTLCGRVQQTERIIKKNHHDVYVPAMFTVQTDYGQMSYHLCASVLHIGEHTTYGHYEAAVFNNSKIGYLCNI